MKHSMFLAVVLSAICLGRVFAQSDVDLDLLDQRIKQHLEAKMPGWTHKRENQSQAAAVS